jgi:hypothetical protein
MKTNIMPTVGRIVWLCFASQSGGLNTGPETLHDGKPLHGYPDLTEQPLAATIAYVHGHDCINVAGVDANGQRFERTSVFLWNGEGSPPTTMHARWMPYQQKQAAAPDPTVGGSDLDQRLDAIETRLKHAGA